MSATPGTDVSLMAKGEGTRAAYRVRCPRCKARPGMFCVAADKPTYYMEPTRDVPAKRPHNERFQAVHDAARREARKHEWSKRADPMAAERAAYADLARREHEELTTWLRRYGRVLWTR